MDIVLTQDDELYYQIDRESSSRRRDETARVAGFSKSMFAFSRVKQELRAVVTRLENGTWTADVQVGVADCLDDERLCDSAEEGKSVTLSQAEPRERGRRTN